MADVKKIATWQSYDEALSELGAAHFDVVVLDADLANATKTEIFKKTFPDRHFDCGISESDMMCVAAGLVFEQVRTSIGYPHLNTNSFTFEIGKGEVLRGSIDMALIANGLLVVETLEAAKLLVERGVNARVIDMATIKPLDEKLVLKAAKECGRIVAFEEHSTIGGLACPVERVDVNDEFGHSGPAGVLLEQFGLCREHVAQVAEKM